MLSARQSSFSLTCLLLEHGEYKSSLESWDVQRDECMIGADISEVNSRGSTALLQLVEHWADHHSGGATGTLSRQMDAAKV